MAVVQEIVMYLAPAELQLIVPTQCLTLKNHVIPMLVVTFYSILIKFSGLEKTPPLLTAQDIALYPISYILMRFGSEERNVDVEMQ